MFSFVLSRKEYETEIVMLLITKQQDEALPGQWGTEKVNRNGNGKSAL